MSEVAEDAGQAGWTLVQLSELVRRAEELLLDGITLVGPYAHADMPADATIELHHAEVRQAVSALTEGVEIAEQLEQLAAQLPDDAVEADYEAVRDAAAEELARGIADPRRLLVAARLLDVAHGWPALSDALSAADVVPAWEELTVAGLLRRFRGAEPQLVEQVAAEAGLEPTARLAACPAERLAALADGLRRHATERPAP